MKECEFYQLPSLPYETLLLPWEESLWHEIPGFVWREVQEEARRRLERSKGNNIDPKLTAHWKNIVDGKPPFGLSVAK